MYSGWRPKPGDRIFRLRRIKRFQLRRVRGDTPKLVGFRVIRDSGGWAIRDQAAYLVVTETNWSNYYSSRPSGLNFATYIYLVALRGVKPNPGYQVRILAIKQLKDRVTIEVELKEPDPRKMYPQVTVHPTAVARIAKANLGSPSLLNFTFVDQEGGQLAVVGAKI